MAEGQLLGVWGPQQWGEPVEGPRDELAEFAKDSKRQIPLSAEGYLSGDLGIDLYVWRWTSRLDTDPSHYVAHCRSFWRMDDLALEMAHSPADLVREFAVNEDLVHRVHGDEGVGVHEEGRMDFSVLVAVGESREDGQEQGLIVPSVVTLESLSFLGGLRADVFEVAMFPELLRGQVGEDREHDVPGLVLGGFSPEMVYGQLPPKVVESTANVVNGVPDHQSPVVTDLRHSLGDPKDEVVLRVKLPSRAENAGWDLSVTRVDNGASEVFYVAMRSVELRPASR